MSLEKTEVRLATTQEVGEKLEDLLEGAKREVAECNGAKTAATMVASRLEERSRNLDTSFQAEGSQIQKEIYDASKKVWAEAMQVARQISSSSTEQYLRCQGKVAALESTVRVVKGLHDTTQAKLTAVQQALKQGTLVVEDSGQLPGQVPGDAPVIPMRRVEGTHPGNPLAALRARADSPQEAPSKPQEELAAPVAAPAPAKPKKPTRRPKA
jgi:hypothetical protein